MSQQEMKAHAFPQMTIEGLARYLTTSNPITRSAIIRDEKFYDSVAQPPYYREIKAGVLRHLCDEDREDRGLLDAAERINSVDHDATEYEITRRSNNAHGLRCLHECRNDFTLDRATYAKPHSTGHSIVAGVKVISSPVVILNGRRKGQDTRGGMKLYLDKPKALQPDQAAFIGTALIAFLSVSDPSCECFNKQVHVVDVFRGTTFVAPDSIKQRTRLIELACVEIATLWDSVVLRRAA